MDTRELNDFKKSLRFAGASGFRVISREGTTIEFKESFNWNSKDKYGKSAAAKTASRDSHDVRKRAYERQAFFGLARCSADDARPAPTSASASNPPRQSARQGSASGAKRSANAMRANSPKPAPELTVKKTMLRAGFIATRQEPPRVSTPDRRAREAREPALEQ